MCTLESWTDGRMQGGDAKSALNGAWQGDQPMTGPGGDCAMAEHSGTGKKSEEDIRSLLARPPGAQRN